jgi:predicted RNA-binding protein YlxR (DUF448 family)
MCMGCGGRAPQHQLLRLSVAADGSLALAPRSPLGRSGYLHRQPQCWERFTARKGPLRSLGRAVEKSLRVTFVQQLQRLEQSAMMR